MKPFVEIKGIKYERADLLMERLGLSYMALYRMTQRQKVPVPIKLGRTSYYPIEATENALVSIT